MDMVKKLLKILKETRYCNNNNPLWLKSKLDGICHILCCSESCKNCPFNTKKSQGNFDELIQELEELVK